MREANSFLEELHEVVELAVHVAAYRHRAFDRLHQNIIIVLTKLIVQILQILTCRPIEFHVTSGIYIVHSDNFSPPPLLRLNFFSPTNKFEFIAQKDAF